MYLAMLLFGGAVWWCLYILRRLPSDLAELARLLGEWRRCRYVCPSDDLRLEERRKADLARGAREFWSTVAVQCCFFWPVTVLLLLCIVVPGFIFAVRSIAGAIRM